MPPKTIIFPEREFKSLEFKSTVPDFNKLIKTCIALANGSGGQIIIGVEDGSRKILGITDKDEIGYMMSFPIVYMTLSVPHSLHRCMKSE